MKKYSPRELIQQPLWYVTVPVVWEDLLIQFSVDALSLKAGFEYWLDWLQARVKGGMIDLAFLEQLRSIPHAIQAQGVAQVNAYLANLHLAIKPLNRVRAIFIGYGDAGKTSVIRVLHDEEVSAGEQAMTPGIEIREWPVPDTDITAHFWDFGGQVMVHAAHQLFLRDSCLYVLVIYGFLIFSISWA